FVLLCHFRLRVVDGPDRPVPVPRRARLPGRPATSATVSERSNYRSGARASPVKNCRSRRRIADSSELGPLGKFEGSSSRRCQTNSNQSLFAPPVPASGGKKAAPLSKCGGAVGLEMIPAGETSAKVEVVVDGRVDGGEHLQTSHPPEPKHRALTSSERKMRVLGAVVVPTPRALLVPAADGPHSRAV